MPRLRRSGTRRHAWLRGILTHRSSLRRVVGVVALVTGAVLFLFPFYFMIVGALQTRAGHELPGAHSRTRAT